MLREILEDPNISKNMPCRSAGRICHKHVLPKLIYKFKNNSNFKTQFLFGKDKLLLKLT